MTTDDAATYSKDERITGLYDLLTWAQAIPETAARTILLNAVKRAGRAQSCRADLVIALHCCDTFTQLQACRGSLTDLRLQTAANALLMQAVLLYSRATATSSSKGERGAISIEDRLPRQLRTAHQRILTVRDRAYAHVHANEEIGEKIWHKEAVYAVVEGDLWLPAAATRRIQTDKSLLADLNELVPYADQLIREIFQKRLDQLTKLMTENVDQVETLDMFPFDANSFFGSQEEAEQALAGRKLGSSFGIISGDPL